MTSGVLLTLAERHEEPTGLRVPAQGQPDGAPLRVRFVLDELSGVRLAFVLRQLARRHVKEGSFGPAWRRTDVPLDASATDGGDPAERILSRLHATETLAAVLRLATPAQVRAIEAKQDGRSLTGPERVALHRLRERIEESGLKRAM